MNNFSFQDSGDWNLEKKKVNLWKLRSSKGIFIKSKSTLFQLETCKQWDILKF